MKGGEAKFWNELRVPFRAMGDCDRIESHATCIGRPDLNLALVGGTTWDIELKYSDNGKVVVRPAQRMWFSKRRKVGVTNACILTKAVCPQGTFYILNLIGDLPDTDKLDDWVAMADHCWDHKIDYSELEGIFRAKE